MGHEPGETIGDSIADDAQAAPERALQERSLALDMDRVLATLAPREAQILRARYGLDDNKLKTLEEVGALFKVGATPACLADETHRENACPGDTQGPRVLGSMILHPHITAKSAGLRVALAICSLSPGAQGPAAACCWCTAALAQAG